MLGYLFDFLFNAKGKNVPEREESLNQLYSNQKMAIMNSSPVYWHPKFGWVDSYTGRLVDISYRGCDKVAIDHYTRKLACNITEEENRNFNLQAEYYAKKVGHKAYIGKVKESDYISGYEIPRWEWKNRLVEVDTGNEIELEFYSRKCEDDIFVYQCIKKSFALYKDLKDYKENYEYLNDGRYRKLIKTEYISMEEFFKLLVPYYYDWYNECRDLVQGKMYQELQFKYEALCCADEPRREDGLHSRYIFDESKLDKSKFINTYEVNPKDVVEYKRIEYYRNPTWKDYKWVTIYKGDKS